MSGAPVQLTLDGAPADAPADGGAAPPPTGEQAEAARTRDRDVFLEAGAGTGKTGVLVRRYCEAVAADGVGVDRILAFTFTEKAAGEVRERIRTELGRRAAAAEREGDSERALELSREARDSERAWITTIHGFCRRLLASHPAAAGVDPRFRVLDEPEAERIGMLAFDEALDELATQGDGRAEAVAAGFRIPRLRALIRTAHEKLRSQGIEHPTLAREPDAEALGAGEDLTDEEAETARAAYECIRDLLAAYGRRYEQLKRDRAGLDFEDLQLRAVRLLQDHPAIAGSWRERFVHVMVDEFQDTNPLQLALIDSLRGTETRLFTVGDEFQSIYGFRFADLEVFRAARDRSAAAPDERVRLLRLGGNFRSHPEVLAGINAVGAALFGDGFQPLDVGRAVDGEPDPDDPRVELLLAEDQGWDDEGIELKPPPEEGSPTRVAEARLLASRLRALADSGVRRGDMVVLLRAFTHVRTYEEALERAGLAPYVVGGRGYWSHQQVEDVLRLLGAVANPLDDEVLFGALASPACGVRADTLWILRRIAGERFHVWPALEALVDDRLPDEGEAPRWAGAVPPDDRERLRGFRATLDAVRREAPLLSLEALVERVVGDFGYDLTALMRRRGVRRLANVRKLMRLAREFEAHEGRSVREFLRYAESRTGYEDREAEAATETEAQDGVRIMTVHGAKGLEFEVVAVAELRRTLLAGRGGTDVLLGPLEDAEAGNGHRPARIGIRLPRAGRRTLTLWDFESLQEQSGAAEAEEECRLAYVAATRARERLILSGSFKEGDLEPCEPRPTDSILRRLLPALGASGTDEVITVPPARPGPELDVELPAGRIAVQVGRASPEAAAALVRPSPAPSTTDGSAPAGPPPLIDREGLGVPAAAGHLSYSALADYARCGYRFYVERVLGLGAPDPDPDQTEREGDELAGEADLESEPPHPGASRRRFGFGAAVHSMLEWSARNRWASPGPDRCVLLLRAEGLAATPDEVERGSALVRGWLESPLRRRLEGGAVRLHPETPFMLALGGTVIRGKIDLLTETEDSGLLVVDYKTDALGGSDPADHAGRYATQRGIYALAAREALGGAGNGAAVRTAYCFLERPDEPVEHSFDGDGLDAVRSELERLVDGVRAGRFEVTAEPHRALCVDCPARVGLCSHEPRATLAARGP
jgi:ATP-dependent helicase/nuclease subunit A